MKIIECFLFACLILLISCNKDSDTSSYPKTFAFHHSTITNEMGFVFGDNKTYNEINSRAGNLDSLRFYVTNDLYHIIRGSTVGYYVESITLLSKDSVRIRAWEDNIFISYTQPAHVENANGEIMDENDFGTTIIWDKNKQEIKFCIALALGIFDFHGNPYFDVDYELCLAKDLHGELQNFLSYNNYIKNDTLGIYMMEMAYKE